MGTRINPSHYYDAPTTTSTTASTVITVAAVMRRGDIVSVQLDTTNAVGGCGQESVRSGCCCCCCCCCCAHTTGSSCISGGGGCRSGWDGGGTCIGESTFPSGRTFMQRQWWIGIGVVAAANAVAATVNAVAAAVAIRGRGWIDRNHHGDSFTDANDRPIADSPMRQTVSRRKDHRTG